jgi:hypothetical protein
MYFNLFLPFPTPTLNTDGTSANDSKKSKKGKGKAASAAPATVVGQLSEAQMAVESQKLEIPGAGGAKYWAGLERDEREKVGKGFALAGHCELSVLLRDWL